MEGILPYPRFWRYRSDGIVAFSIIEQGSANVDLAVIADKTKFILSTNRNLEHVDRQLYLRRCKDLY